MMASKGMVGHLGQFNAVEEALQRCSSATPAITVAAVKDGQIVYSGAVGDCLDLPADAERTVFMTASISKTINGVLCMLMKESGELDLDMDVSRYLGFLIRNPNFPAVPITARQLLLHKSSLRDDEDAVNMVGDWKTKGEDCAVTLEQYVRRRLVDVCPHEKSLWSKSHEPGKGYYHYSNAGATLLGYVLEKASGEPFTEIVQKRVFDVLGMTRSKYTLVESRALDDAVLATPHSEEIGHYGLAEVPAAGLRSTAIDLARLLAVLMCPGKLLSAASIDEMLPKDGCAGLGWWGQDFPYRATHGTFSHGGFMTGVRTHIYIWPAERLGAVILTNAACDYSPISAAMAKSLMEAS